jgi:ABC-type multidrug transport system fused ATPase/permease subunit
VHRKLSLGPPEGLEETDMQHRRAPCSSLRRRPAPAPCRTSACGPPNEFVTFVGASGCGKSTLLRMIGGLEQHSGEQLVDGRAITGPGPDRGMVFQHYSLYPWLTVRENIKFCRQLKVHPGERSDADVEAAGGRAERCSA